jgi:hypothetical protein
MRISVHDIIEDGAVIATWQLLDTALPVSSYRRARDTLQRPDNGYTRLDDIARALTHTMAHDYNNYSYNYWEEGP